VQNAAVQRAYNGRTLQKRLLPVLPVVLSSARLRCGPDVLRGSEFGEAPDALEPQRDTAFELNASRHMKRVREFVRFDIVFAAYGPAWH
jgi:hypothetical protein